MNVGDYANSDSGVLSEPFGFLDSGRYYWNYSGLDLRGRYGYAWSSHANETATARSLGYNISYFAPALGQSKGYGIAVRCEAILIYYCLTINELRSRSP